MTSNNLKEEPVLTVPIAKTLFDQQDFEAVQIPLETGWVVQGPRVKQFEDQFCAFTGLPHAVAVSSCTTALHLAMIAAGINPGDEVIVPAFTWIATANAVEYVGARPIFCDISLASYNLDIDELPGLITPKTKAIVAVHLFGMAAELDPILNLAKQRKLKVIEDAACAFGAYYRGRHVGGFGDIGCFSFHPRKAISTGEGGMVTVQDAGKDALLRSLRDHGASKSDAARHASKDGFLLSEYNHLGYNYRMTDIQGSLGVSQLAKAPWIQEQRARRAARYSQLLAQCKDLQLPQTPRHMVHGWQSYVCLYAPEQPSQENCRRLHEQRNTVMLGLEKRGVATRQGTHAVTLQNYYQRKYGIAEWDFPKAALADRLTIALPLYPQMTDREQDYVVSCLCEECEGLS